MRQPSTALKLGTIVESSSGTLKIIYKKKAQGKLFYSDGKATETKMPGQDQ